jgi:hypothetical protein
LADFVDYIEKKFFIKEPYFFGVGGIPVRRGGGLDFEKMGIIRVE